MVTFVVTKKLGRFYEFPVLIHVSDAILFVCSVLVIEWFNNKIDVNINTDPLISSQEFSWRIQSNFIDNIEYPFQYLFAGQVSCLILRIAINLQFNESIGPLIKIVGKMT